MLKFSIIDQKKYFKNKQKLYKMCLLICQELTKILMIKKLYFFDCNIVDQSEITLINSKYRKVNNTTDVISFSFYDNKSLKTKLLGEIYICYQVCVKQAMKNKCHILYQFATLFIHGLLHLFGYDHLTSKDWKKNEMISTKVLNKIKKFNFND